MIPLLNDEVMRYFCTLLTFLLSAFGTLQAQQATVSAGGDASGNGGSVSYSVGQVMYTHSEGTRSTVSHGVQQPFEIHVYYGEREQFISLELSVYPNPTVGMLFLNTGTDQRDFQYKLFNLQGKLIQESSFTAQAEIDLKPQPRATYLLHILHQQEVIKSYRIVKN
ncbi:T9SS type A sorting domain-containing protein [bacterium SCSIO 12741]|nr:T9SS type A sorting domain-containing protein [bacterium SCSIO 12741]